MAVNEGSFSRSLSVVIFGNITFEKFETLDYHLLSDFLAFRYLNIKSTISMSASDIEAQPHQAINH